MTLFYLFACLQFPDGSKTSYVIHCSNSGLSVVLLKVVAL